MSTVIEDPFEEDLVSDERIGGMRKGVVIAIAEAQAGSAADGSDAVAANATVLISTLEQIMLPFKGGIEWLHRLSMSITAARSPQK